MEESKRSEEWSGGREEENEREDGNERASGAHGHHDDSSCGGERERRGVPNIPPALKVQCTLCLASFLPSFLPSLYSFLPTDQLAVGVVAPSELYFRGIRMTTAALRDLATWPTFPLPVGGSLRLLVAMAVATLALFT